MAGKKGAGKKMSEMSADERYQALVKKKLEQQKASLMMEKKTFSHQLPGTQPQQRELSKSTQEALEKIAERRAKKEMKMFGKDAGSDDLVKPMNLFGMNPGYIDKKGRICASGGDQILQIDKKTGQIKTLGFLGRSIGKFDPKSISCMNKIHKYLANHAEKKKKNQQSFNPWGGATQQKDVWGNPIKPFNPWGGSDDNNNNGWW